MATDKIEIVGEDLKDSIKGGYEVVRDADIIVTQRPYFLTESDFLLLSSKDSPLRSWTLNVLIASIGFGISVFAKVLAKLIWKKNLQIENWEYITIAIVAFISLVLHIISRCLPSVKKCLMRKISGHFKKYTPEVEVRSQRAEYEKKRN